MRLRKPTRVYRPYTAPVAHLARWRVLSVITVATLCLSRHDQSRHLAAKPAKGCLARVRGDRRLRNCNSVVVITGVLGKQEDVLMRLRGPIRHAFRQRVRFMPNNVRAQIPSVSL